MPQFSGAERLCVQPAGFFQLQRSFSGNAEVDCELVAGPTRDFNLITAFLASPAARNITGQIIAVDGGFIVSLPYGPTADWRRSRAGRGASTDAGAWLPGSHLP